jgi:alpha-amylase/alpha-mannosidase (GH57 family)
LEFGSPNRFRAKDLLVNRQLFEILRSYHWRIFSAPPFVINSSTNVNTVQRHFTAPYMQMWNFNVQRQIGRYARRRQQRPPTPTDFEVALLSSGAGYFVVDALA